MNDYDSLTCNIKVFGYNLTYSLFFQKEIENNYFICDVFTVVMKKFNKLHPEERDEFLLDFQNNFVNYVSETFQDFCIFQNLDDFLKEFNLIK